MINVQFKWGMAMAIATMVSGVWSGSALTTGIGIVYFILNPLIAPRGE